MAFSQLHADAACNFFERVLRHTTDEWYGKSFILTPWEEEAVATIFGQLDDDGNRLVKLAFFELPKKAGKTEFAAGLVLFVLVTDPNPGCQVYGAPAATRQALNVCRAACKMVEQSPLLRKRLRLLRGTNRIIRRDDPDSFYAAVAADEDMSDGVNPSFVVADELHRWRTRKQLENFDVLSLGGITRRQPLTIGLTTAGVQNESPLAWRLHEKTRRLQQGVASDPSFVGRIYGASPKDDWTSERTWIKANPSLKENGGFLDISKIREKYEASLSDPESQRSFRRYYLNVWDLQERRVIDLAKWDSSSGNWAAAGLIPRPPGERVRPLPSRLMAYFRNRRCWAGVDLSMTTDLTAVSFVFPCEDGGYDVLPFFWIPEEGVRPRELRDGVPYRRWVEDGFMEASLGNVIDYREVKVRLEWGRNMFELVEVCFDPWNSRQISVPMAEEGYSCVEIRQGVMSLSEPSKKTLELVTSEKLYHGGHPVLRWNASCLTAKESNDNLMFSKPERSTNSPRIDGISATVNALARAMVAMPKKRSIYATRGIRTISLV